MHAAAQKALAGEIEARAAKLSQAPDDFECFYHDFYAPFVRLRDELPAKSADQHGLGHDTKRDRLLFFSDAGPKRGNSAAYDVKTGEAALLSVRLDPDGTIAYASLVRSATIYHGPAVWLPESPAR